MDTPILIALVEDEALIQEVLRTELEDAGYTVETASDGKQAIAMLEAKHAEVRALITDIKFPGKITGWDVARRARQLVPELPVVYMSGDSGAEWSANGVPKSVIIAKPFAVNQVVVAVSNLLNVAS